MEKDSGLSEQRRARGLQQGDPATQTIYRRLGGESPASVARYPDVTHVQRFERGLRMNGAVDEGAQQERGQDLRLMDFTSILRSETGLRRDRAVDLLVARLRENKTRPGRSLVTKIASSDGFMQWFRLKTTYATSTKTGPEGDLEAITSAIAHYQQRYPDILDYDSLYEKLYFLDEDQMTYIMVHLNDISLFSLQECLSNLATLPVTNCRLLTRNVTAVGPVTYSMLTQRWFPWITSWYTVGSDDWDILGPSLSMAAGTQLQLKIDMQFTPFNPNVSPSVFIGMFGATYPPQSLATFYFQSGSTHQTQAQMNVLEYSVRPFDIVVIQPDIGDSTLDITISIALVNDPVATPVVIQNREPIWISPEKPQVYPEPMPTSLPGDYVPCAVYYTRAGTDHMPMWTVYTERDGKSLVFTGGSKKDVKSKLAAHLQPYFIGKTIKVIDCGSRTAWEKAKHNKTMHAINGNLARKVMSPKPKDLKKIADIATAVTTPICDNPNSVSNRMKKLKSQEQSITIEVKNAIKEFGFNTVMDVVDQLSEGLDSIYYYEAGMCVMFILAEEIDIQRVDHMRKAVERFKRQEDDECMYFNDSREERELNDRTKATLTIVSEKKPSRDTKRPLEQRPDQRERKAPTPIPTDDEKNKPAPATAQEWTTYRERKRKIVERIAKHLPRSWESLIWLRDGPASKEFKTAVWDMYSAEIICDDQRKTLDCISVAGYLLLSNTAEYVYAKFLDLCRLDRRIEDLGPFTHMTFDGAEISTLLKQGVRAQEAEAHNKLMHALTGNTTQEIINKRKTVSEMLSTSEEGEEMDAQKLVARSVINPAEYPIGISDFTEALVVHADIVDETNRITTGHKVPLPVNCLYPTQGPDYGYLHVVVNPAGPPNKQIFVSLMKGDFSIVLSEIGKALYDRQVQQNVLTAKNDLYVQSGFNINDIIGLVRTAPLYGFSPESWVLKLMLYHQVVSFATTSLSQQPCWPGSMFEGYELGGLGWTVEHNDEFHEPTYTSDEVFPNSGTAGVIAFHVTTKTVPIGESYYYFPSVLATRDDVYEMLALFVMMVSEFPFEQYRVRPLDEGVLKDPLGLAPDLPFTDEEYVHIGNTTYIPGDLIVNIILPCKNYQAPPTTHAAAGRMATFRPYVTRGGALADINAIGLVKQDYSLWEFLSTWLSPVYVGAGTVRTFSELLSTLFPIYDVMYRMEPMMDYCSNYIIPGLWEPGNTAWPFTPWNPTRGAACTHYDLLLREGYVQAVNQEYEPEDVDNPAFWISDPDFNAWNMLATGLYTVSTKVINNTAPLWLGQGIYTNLWSAWRASQIAATFQVWWAEFGLNSATLFTIKDNSEAPYCYRQLFRSMWSVGVGPDMYARPTDVSAVLSSLYVGLTGFKFPKWNNGLYNITFFDRLYNRPLAKFYMPYDPVNYQGVDTIVPVAFCDVVLNAILKNPPLWLSIFPGPVPGVAVFDLPLDLRPTNLRTFTLLGEVFKRANDTQHAMATIDDKSKYNMRLAYYMAYDKIWNYLITNLYGQAVPANQTAPTGVFRQRISTRGSTMLGIPIPTALYITTYTYPMRSDIGYYLFMRLASGDGQVLRRSAYGQQLLTIGTWRMGELAPLGDWYDGNATHTITSSYMRPQITKPSGKDQTPPAEDPIGGNGGN